MSLFEPFSERKRPENEATLSRESWHNFLRKPIKCAANYILSSDDPNTLALKGS
jgi:hypothetical protein